MNWNLNSNSGGSQSQGQGSTPGQAGGATPPGSGTPPASPPGTPSPLPTPGSIPAIPTGNPALPNTGSTPPNVPTTPAPGENGAPTTPVPGVTPEGTPAPEANPNTELDSLKKQISDKDRYIRQLTEERNLSYETIQQKTEQIEEIKGKVTDLKQHMSAIVQRSRDPNMTAADRQNDLLTYQLLKDDVREAEDQIRTAENDSAQYNRIMETAYSEKAPYVQDEIIAVCNKYAHEMGGDANRVLQFIETQVYPMTNDPRVMEQYLTGRLSIEDMYNHAYGPSRNMYSKLNTKTQMTIPTSGVEGGGAPPVAPAAPARPKRKFFT